MKSDQLRRYQAWLTILFPILYMSAYIYFFGVNIPFRDGWVIPHLLDRLSTGQLGLEEVFAQHNEHRPFFPQIIILIISLSTNYDSVVLMYISYILLVSTSFVLWTQFKSNISTDDRALTLVLFSPIIWLVLSPRKHSNLLMGYDIQMFLMIFGVVSAIYLVSTRTKADILFLFAVIPAFVASFSRIEGLAVWPVGLLLILLSEEGGLKRTLIWVSAAIISFILYFYNWGQPGSSPPLSALIYSPIETIGYFFVSIGSPLMFYEEGVRLRGYAPDYSLILIAIFVVGVAIFSSAVLFIYIINADDHLRASEYTFWIGLVLFAVAVSGMLTIGRSGLGIDQATSSRYTGMTSFLYIGLYAMYSDLILRRDTSFGNWKRNIHYVVVALFVIGIMIGYVGGTVAEINRSSNLREACYAVLDYESSSDESLSILTTPNGSIDRLREGAAILDKHNWGPFNQQQDCSWHHKTKNG